MTPPLARGFDKGNLSYISTQFGVGAPASGSTWRGNQTIKPSSALAAYAGAHGLAVRSLQIDDPSRRRVRARIR